MRQAQNVFLAKASGGRFSSYLLFEEKVLAVQDENNIGKTLN